MNRRLRSVAPRGGFRSVVGAVLVLACLVPIGCSPRPSPAPHGPPPPSARPPQGRPGGPPQRNPLRPLVFYIPNRVVDLLDAVSVGVGLPSVPYLLPASLHANVHATRALQAGAGSTHGMFVGKGYQRQFLWLLEHHEFSLGPLVVWDLEYEGDELTTEIKEVGVLTPSDEPFAAEQMDYWAVGGHLGVLPVAVSVDLHPVELADAILGFFLVDFRGDDH